MAQVLTASPHESAAHFSPRHLSRSPPKASSFFLDSSAYSISGVASPSIPDPHSAGIDMHSTRSSSAPSSPRQSYSSLSRTSSFQSTAPSSVSFNAYQSHSGDEDDEDENDLLPSYGRGAYQSKQYATASVEESSQSASDLASSTTDDDVPSSPSFPHVADDTEAREEPSRQVDYLSHNWREEDIWSSWKHIVSRRKEYGEMSRLENASWRTWAKSKNNLKTVSPERLNWLKDCDVTWLYGPLQQGSHGRQDTPASCFSHSKNNSFINKKSNLKKRSVSEVMLQKSLSSSSLVKQAAAAVQAQRSSSCSNNEARPSLERGRSDFGPGGYKIKAPSDYSTVLTSNCSSEVHSPEAQSRRHIRFDTKVEQCIAVEFKEATIEEEDMGHVSEHALGSASSSSEDDLPMMKTRARSIPSRQNSQPPSSRNSFSNGESKGIAKLPSTQIRFHADEAEEQQQQQQQQRQQQEQSASFFSLPAAWRSSGSNNTSPALDKSPSQETLRPSKASANFFADDPELDGMIDWQSSSSDSGSSRTNAKRSDSSTDLMSSSVETLRAGGSASQEEYKDGLRRTPSGMFMPFDENNDDENLANVGVFGRVIDTVNTARDIAHVIWNVGWRK